MLYRHRAFARALALVLISSVAFAARSAHAFFDPPWITPAAPRAGEVVSVNIRGGICDGIIEWPGYPQLTQQGNVIHIVEYGVHVDFVDWCIYGTGTVTVPIGAFQSGSYTLTVDFAYDDALYGPTIITLGVLPFTVTGVTPAKPVPTTNLTSLLALLLLVVSLAVWAMRNRRQDGG